MKPFVREWGAGPPVVALHPLGLESSGFAGFGAALARRGLRTIAVDLPGFGRSPAPCDAPLRPDVLAAPVIELARSLDEAPVVLGISLGGRVALEAALTAPAAFRGVVAIAPYLPWLRYRPLLQTMGWVDPRLAGWLPLERAWPLLRWATGVLERMPYIQDDEIAQAAARLVYGLACPATRTAFLSAARELALDPADGADGLWQRLTQIAIPTAFVWAQQDVLVSLGFAHRVAGVCPGVRQLVLPCAGHWLNGAHHRCLAETIAGLVAALRDSRRWSVPGPASGEALTRVGAAQLASQPCRVTAAPRAVPATAPGLLTSILSATPFGR